jgi:hypothetical protein
MAFDAGQDNRLWCDWRAQEVHSFKRQTLPPQRTLSATGLPVVVSEAAYTTAVAPSALIRKQQQHTRAMLEPAGVGVVPRPGALLRTRRKLALQTTHC